MNNGDSIEKGLAEATGTGEAVVLRKRESPQSREDRGATPSA